MNANSDRLKEVLAIYGADPQHWPAGERATLLASMAEAPALAAEAAEVDLVLGRAAMVKVPPHLAARIKAGSGGSTPAAVVHIPSARRSSWSWISAAALAASLALGIYIGLASGSELLLDSGSAEIDDAIVLTGIGDAPELIEGEG